MDYSSDQSAEYQTIKSIAHKVMTIFGKKTLLILGMLLAQQLALHTAAWAADPAAKPQKTFDQCLMNGRLTFKDGAKGCIENYPGLMTNATASWYTSPQWDLGATRPIDRCPAVVGAPNIRGGSTEASAIVVCQDKLRSLVTGGIGCDCDSVFSIAKTLTRDQFEQYAKDFLPTGSGRITGFSIATSVAYATAAPNIVPAQATTAPAQANPSQESRQQIEVDRLQAQIKLEEERKRQELAKADETRRQQELQQKLAEARRQEEQQLKLAEERRQQEILVKLEYERMRLEAARAEEQLRRQEMQQKLAEERRQQEAAARMSAEREAARLAAEKAKQTEIENAKLATEVARLRDELTKAQAQNYVQTANRKALVIGNDKYTEITRLSNAGSDAKLMAERLKSVGYAVAGGVDLTQRDMLNAIRQFKSQINPGDEVAIFFSGHGTEINGTSYLLPTDVRNANTVEQVKDEAISLQRVLDDMSERKAKLTLAVIDACRNNPFRSQGRAIGGARGLAPTTAATGQMIVYAAGAGQTALDNLGKNDPSKNGVFTRVFAQEMLKPGMPIDQVVRAVRDEVARLAETVGHEQVPAIYDQVRGQFYFNR